MKKIYLFLMFTISIVMLNACGNDCDEAEDTTKLFGTYSGEAKINVFNISDGQIILSSTEPATVTLTRYGSKVNYNFKTTGEWYLSLESQISYNDDPYEKGYKYEFIADKSETTIYTPDYENISVYDMGITDEFKYVVMFEGKKAN